MKKATPVVEKKVKKAVQPRNYVSMRQSDKRNLILLGKNLQGTSSYPKEIRKFLCTPDLPRAMMEYDVKPNRASL
jgi:hypothetical protein